MRPRVLGLASLYVLSLLAWGCVTASTLDPATSDAALNETPNLAASSGPANDTVVDPTPSPEAVVQAQLAAYNARDIDAFAATLHPQVELYALGEDTPRASGVEAVRALYADLFANSEQLHSELVHRAVVGTRVVDHERITGRRGGDVLELVMVYEVEDGKIRRAWSVR